MPQPASRGAWQARVCTSQRARGAVDAELHFALRGPSHLWATCYMLWDLSRWSLQCKGALLIIMFMQHQGQGVEGNNLGARDLPCSCLPKSSPALPGVFPGGCRNWCHAHKNKCKPIPFPNELISLEGAPADQPTSIPEHCSMT